MANNYKHLSLKDREKIEECLNENIMVNKIARILKVNHSTIIREIERNKVYLKPSSWNNYHARCKNYDTCNKPDNLICSESRDCFVRNTCDKLNRSPHVCNGCKSRSGCRKERFTYYARKANDSYKEVISEVRKGISLTEEEVFNINNVITPLIMKGQTVNHVYINHPEVLNISKTSFINWYI